MAELLLALRELQRQGHNSPSSALVRATATVLSSLGPMILMWERQDGMVLQRDNMGLKADAGSESGTMCGPRLVPKSSWYVFV